MADQRQNTKSDKQKVSNNSSANCEISQQKSTENHQYTNGITAPRLAVFNPDYLFLSNRLSSIQMGRVMYGDASIEPPREKMSRVSLLMREGHSFEDAIAGHDTSGHSDAIHDVLQQALNYDPAPGPDFLDPEFDEFEPDLYDLALNADNPNELPRSARKLIAHANAKAEVITKATTHDAFRLYEHTGIRSDAKPIVLQVTPGGGKTHAYIEECKKLLESTKAHDQAVWDSVPADQREDLLSEPVTRHVDIYVPTHDLAGEVAVRLHNLLHGEDGLATYDIVLMKGRAGLCQRGEGVSELFFDSKASMAANACERTEKVTKRSDNPTDFNEYEVTQTLRCPHYDECGYMANIDAVRFSDKRVVFRIWPHAYLTLAMSFNIPPAEIVVIDEDASGQFVKESKHDFGLFSGLHLQTKRFDRQGQESSSLTDYQRADYLAILDSVGAAMEAAERALTKDLNAIQRRHNNLRSDACQNEVKLRVGKNGIMRAVCKAVTREQVEFLREIDQMNVRRIFANPSDDDQTLISNMPRDNVRSLEMIKLWDTLLSEWDSGSDDARQISWEMQTKDGEMTATGEFHITRIDKSQNPEAGDVTNGRLANCRGNLLLADATPNLPVMREALGELNHVKAAFYENAVVYLDATKSYSKSRLGGDEAALRDLADKIKGIMAAHGYNGLVDCPKDIREDLERLLPELAGKFLHFGADRGVDAYKDADWVVVIGGQRPNPDQHLRQVNAIYVNDPKPVDPSIFKAAGQVQVRTPPGGDLSLSESVPASGVTFPKFADERVQAGSDHVFEGGLTQANGRVRSARAVEPKRIFVFAANLPTGLFADFVEQGKQTQQKNNRGVRVFERSGGVFIGRGEWLHSIAPDDFQTIKAAKNWIQSNSKDLKTYLAIESLIAPSVLRDNSQKTAIYSGTAKVRSLSGAKNRASECIVHVSAVNYEEALEKLSEGAAMGGCAVSGVDIAKSKRVLH